MSTYSTNLALELIGNGEQAGNWGQTTNTNLGTLVEQAISGYTTQAITDGGDTTLTMTQGASATARNMYIELTGALTAARNLVVPSNRKLYFIFNNTTGGFAVTVKVSGQTGVSVPNGTKTILVSNGTDIVLAVSAAATGVTSVAMTVPTFLSVAGSPITSTGTLAVSLSGSALPTANGGTGSTSTAYCSLTSNVSGTLPVANGGTGQSSLTAAGIITTGGGQTISGNLTTTTDLAAGGNVYANELYVGTATTLSGYNAKGNLQFNGAVQSGFVMQTTSSSNSNCMLFLNSAGTPLGSIFVIPGSNSVTFNDLSDYRMKYAIAPMTGALAKVALLKPCTYKWKNNDAESQGFIAHELQEVVKECVTGEKDEVNADGSIKAQGVDPRKLVATLTAAIQELKALVDAQAARITALESR